MKATLAKTLGLGIGALAVALYLWLKFNPAADPSQAEPTPAVGQNSPVSASSTSVGYPTSSSWTEPEAEHATRSASPDSTRIHAIIRTKLQQWRNTETGDTVTQEAITQELIQMLSDVNTAEIVRSLSPPDLHMPFGDAAMERWLDIAPTEAAEWLATRPDATERQAWLVANRFQEAPAALLAYCDQLPTNPWKELLMRHASLSQADTDPSAAIAFAERLAPGNPRADAFETIAYSWFERDSTAAFAWVETVSDATLRERLLAMGAKAIARVDPDLALEWLEAGVISDTLFEETALSIAETQALP